MSGTVWEGRFDGRGRVAGLDAFNASIGKDIFLADAEIRASAAYARGLHRASVLSSGELDDILAGLERVRAGIEAGEDLGRFEDVHSAVEILLTEDIGETGKKLHSGRSRNEQVVTDERLYLKDRLPAVVASIEDVQRAILRLAWASPGAVMPGYTHLQQGQCVLFAHYILSFFWPMERGKARIKDALRRIDACPLGSGALAGSTVPLDRAFVGGALGFGTVTENSIDAVTDRTFILEALFALGLVLLDLSRLAEDVVIFSSAEFGFLKLDDRVATSSSLMPQKKNPDIFELIRSAPARLFGALSQLFMIVKGLPSAYNKDLQEDKLPLFRGIEDAAAVLGAAASALGGIVPDADRMRAALSPGLYATDLVDYLTDRGVAFRAAHGIVGRIVRSAESSGRPLSGLSLEDFWGFHPAFGPDVFDVFDPLRSLERKRTEGSTRPEDVRRQWEAAAALVGPAGLSDTSP
jgi:argininosuccinate lyase